MIWNVDDDGEMNSPQEPKMPKGCTRVKHRKMDYQVLKNSKSETSSEIQESAQTCPTDNYWFHDVWSHEEWSY